MKKKLIVLALLVSLVFSMTACGGLVGMMADRDKDEEKTSGYDSKPPVDESMDDEVMDDELEDVENDPVDEPEKEENEQADKPELPTELSDDLYSYQVSINGEVYQFPMWAKDFKALGWTYTGTATEEDKLASYEYISAEKWEKDGVEVYTTLANLTMNSLAYDEAMVAGMDFDKYYMADCDWEIVLPKGITRGVSTKEDVLNAYGEPDDEYDGSLYWNATYETDTYSEVEIYVYKESGIVEEIEIRNIVELEGGDNTVDATVPEAVKNYKAPTELGNDLYTYNFELEGNLYTFPCPVSEFVKNGFEINEQNSEMEIGSGSYGWVELTYDGDSYRCIVDNYADYATIVENCFVTDIEYDEYGPKWDLTIPCDISNGDSEEDLLKKLEGFNYEVDEGTGSYNYYEIYAPGDEYGSSVTIRVKEGKIVGIEVEYDD